MSRLPNPLGRVGAAAQNALEVARFGGLETTDEPAPFEVVAKEPVFRLRRYFPDDIAEGSGPVVLVPPMMLSAEVWDVSEAASAVRELRGAGADPWVVDFGAPEHEAGGLERTLTDHVIAVSHAVDKVREVTGKDVHLGGYSQGGMFCYQTAAYRRGDGLASLVTFGSPVDISELVPFGLPEEFAARLAAGLAETFGRRNLPAWVSRTGFRLMDPVKAARQQLDFVLQLHDREALLPREAQRRFLQAEGFVAWPGPALADFMRQFVAHNRMLRGGFLIEDRLVTLADIDCPVLMFVGEVDEIAPPASVRALPRAAPRADVYERLVRAGHFGLVVGSTAVRETWPDVAQWVRWVEGRDELPATAKHLEEAKDVVEGSAGTARRAAYGLQLAGGVGAGIAKSVVTTTTRTASSLRHLGAEAAEQLPRLARLEQSSPRSRISLGLLLDEQARKRPDGTCFLFEDRAHTYSAAKHRIDSVVRGLVSLGVRQGEHVGVLMDMRPSALSTVSALNRLGAVAVLLRPDGAVTLEAELGQVSRIITDPDHVDSAVSVGVQVLVLGGGAKPRDLGVPVVDMERIDPDTVELPKWYSPNPGRARDLAFILFTGEGERTRMSRITNRRWILSAVGTASSASLGESDTVYSVTPIYHPSALLVSIGGAVAGGSRIALARHFDPTTFWAEIRRYGVTVASYTWTMLRDLVEAPPEAGERGHPVRLFVGSGMPPALWARVLERFAPARVVEFYTASRGDAILVNLGGSQKVGAMGRPLPGSARVRIAAYDAEAEQLVTGPDGFAVRSERGERGMLLAEVHDDSAIADESPLRGVFKRDDAWLATGDLFRRDEDGDYWLIDPVGTLIRTRGGLVSPAGIRAALGALEAVDLVVSYGVPGPGGDIAVAAISLRAGHKLKVAEVTAALRQLDPAQRPSVVRVVDDIPVTTWFRPVTGPLREDGIPAPGGALPAWVFDPAGDIYKKLTITARQRLLAES